MNYFYLVPSASIVALIFAYYFYKTMLKESEGTEKMQTIARYVREGAMSYLKQQYRVVTIVFIILALLFGVMVFFDLQNRWVPFAFLTGGFFSGLAGCNDKDTTKNRPTFKISGFFPHTLPRKGAD